MCQTVEICVWEDSVYIYVGEPKRWWWWTHTIVCLLSSHFPSFPSGHNPNLFSFSPFLPRTHGKPAPSWSCGWILISTKFMACPWLLLWLRRFRRGHMGWLSSLPIQNDGRLLSSSGIAAGRHHGARRGAGLSVADAVDSSSEGWKNQGSSVIWLNPFSYLLTFCYARSVFSFSLLLPGADYVLNLKAS